MRIFHDDVDTLVFEGLSNSDTVSFMGTVLDLVDGRAKVSGIQLGQYQYVDSTVHGKVLIEQRFIVKTDYFDQNFTDAQVKLGSYVSGDKTIFNLWAPTAVGVKLNVLKQTLEMNRSVQGVYSMSLDGDLNGEVYTYTIDINGEVKDVSDPYAKATLPNRKASVVADFRFDKVPFELKEDLILETHVRDFSMDPTVPFKHRAQLLGMLESHDKYGFQHILDLGVDVVQLQPLTDFETVDELDVFSKYNWGYDPMQFFALEGSYSSNIKDPLQVLRDFSYLVNEYHKHGLGITMDVVYNHIYEVEGSSLHDCVPYYYFRYVDGVLSNGTYCGNEIASEYTMVRKFIMDACIYFVERFDIDGYRFDLMGISDIKTMNAIRDELLKIKPNILLYGEGWNMDCGIDEAIRATMQNCDQLPGYKFFNDKFRNTIGGALDGSDLGIANPKDIALIDDALNGSPSIFQSPSQSINYVECHDNYALADKLKLQGRGVEAAYIYNEAVIKAKGHAFLQIGQSFFRNKKGVENSYKSDDEVNMIRWSYLDEYSDLNDKTIEYIKRRVNLSQGERAFENGQIVIK